jgi:hypothetical protein
MKPNESSRPATGESVDSNFSSRAQSPFAHFSPAQQKGILLVIGLLIVLLAIRAC